MIKIQKESKWDLKGVPLQLEDTGPAGLEQRGPDVNSQMISVNYQRDEDDDNHETHADTIMMI